MKGAVFIAACSALTADASAMLKRSIGSHVSRPCLRMSDERPRLSFNTPPDLPEGAENAPVLDKEEADELAGKGSEDEPAPPQLRPETELTDAEVRDRARMLAIKKYAPWMADLASPEAIALREDAERQRKQKKAEKLVGNRIDPAKQEVAGAGLKIRVSTGDEGGNVRLSWSTDDEDGNQGFIVARRRSGQSEFEKVASYESFQSLRSKGPAGGAYTFIDESVPPGSYLYKVQDVATGTNFVTDVCQRACEVQTTDEQKTNLVLVAGFGAVMLALFAVGIALDPQ